MEEVSKAIARHNIILIARQLMMTPQVDINNNSPVQMQEPQRKLPPNSYR